MARLRWRYTVLPIAIGMGLYQFGRRLELIGDLDAVAGQQTSAAGYHGAALCAIVAALGCFLLAGVKIVQAIRGGNSSPPPAPPPPPSQPDGSGPAQDTSAFDPDAIMARYLAARDTPAQSPTQAPPAKRGFGRKPI